MLTGILFLQSTYSRLSYFSVTSIFLTPFVSYRVGGVGHLQPRAFVPVYRASFGAAVTAFRLFCETGINLPAPFNSFPGPTGPPSTLPLSTQTSSGSSTLSKKRPPPPPPGHKRALSDPPSPLPHGPPNKGAVPWGKSPSSQGHCRPGPGSAWGSAGSGHLAHSADGPDRAHAGVRMSLTGLPPKARRHAGKELGPFKNCNNNNKALSISCAPDTVLISLPRNLIASQ